MKNQRRFLPTISGLELESRTVLSHAGSVIAAATSHVAHLALAGGVPTASANLEAGVHADKKIQAPSRSQAMSYWQARDQVVLARLTAAGNTITAAAGSPGSAAARQVLNGSFWMRVNQLDKLQMTLSPIITNDLTQVIQDPIVSNPAFHGALQTLIQDNATWFSSHPNSQRIALGLLYKGDYVGTYTSTWNSSSTVNGDSQYASSGTVTLQILSFHPSAADPSVGAIEGTITIGDENLNDYYFAFLSGNMTSTQYQLSGTVIILFAHYGTPAKFPVTINGGSPKRIDGAFELTVQANNGFHSIDGKGTFPGRV